MRQKRIRKTKTKTDRLLYLNDPKSAFAEAYRTLRTNIRYSTVNRELRTLMITSSAAGEGKTTTAANLALAMAQEGQRVLLIDGDLRHPSLHRFFSISNEVGLTDLLIRTQETGAVIRRFPKAGLDVITAGGLPPNPAELLGSERMGELLRQFHGEYDIVLLDSPPILPVTDGQLLSRLVDGVLLVLRAGEVRREHAKKAKHLLDHVGANVIGAVLNGKKLDLSTYEYRE